VEEPREGEAGYAVGRDYYGHGATRLGIWERVPYGMAEDGRSPDGIFGASQIAGPNEPFRSAIREHPKGHALGIRSGASQNLTRF